MFPSELDGAVVLFYTPKGDYGTIKYTNGDISDYYRYFAICKYEDDTGYYLFCCDEKYDVVSDSFWDSVEECMEVAASYNENVIWHERTDNMVNTDVLARYFEEKINRHIAERERLDLNAVYDRLKDCYPLILTNTFSLENGAEDYGEDFLILCGEAAIGKFQIYDNGLDIIFDVDKADGTYTHWHPSGVEEVVEDIRNFMQGKCKQS